MLRVLIVGLSILHLGPGLAFALVAFGCDDGWPMLASICQQDTFAAFIKLTCLLWAVLILAYLLKLFISNHFNKNK